MADEETKVEETPEVEGILVGTDEPAVEEVTS